MQAVTHTLQQVRLQAMDLRVGVTAQVRQHTRGRHCVVTQVMRDCTPNIGPLHLTPNHRADI